MYGLCLKEPGVKRSSILVPKRNKGIDLMGLVRILSVVRDVSG